MSQDSAPRPGPGLPLDPRIAAHMHPAPPLTQSTLKDFLRSSEQGRETMARLDTRLRGGR